MSASASSSFANHKAGLVAELTTNRTTRPSITVGSAFHAAGGVLLGIAIALFASDVFSNDTGINVAGGFIFLVIALAAIWFVAMSQRSLIVWATGALQVLVPFTLLWLMYSRFVKLEIGWPLMLTALVLAILWCLPGFKARPSLLAAVVLWTTLGIAILVAQSSIQDLLMGLGFSSLPELASDTGVILMLLGVVWLIIGWRFDRAKWPNLATPFIAVGNFALIAGTYGYLSREDLGDVWASILVVVLSLAVIGVGTSAKRRATTWIATFFFAVGLINLVEAILSNDASLKTSAIVLAIAAAVLAVLGKRSSSAREY
ncbi:MAG: hypothetical protein WC864_05950 [Ilumatobacteraceae bacterium]